MGAFGLGRLFGRLRRRVAPTDTAGLPGFSAYGGEINLDEKDRKLEGIQRFREFSDILANTEIVAASVRYFLNLLGRSGWNLEPSDPNSAAAKEMADWVWDVLNEMETPWARAVRRAGMFPFYGFSVQEWTAKRRDDGTIGLLDLEPRPQVTIDRWDLDEHGRVIGMVQVPPQTQRDIYLPREKVLYLVDDALADSPVGLGLFRHLVGARRRLEQYQKLEAYSFETNLRGIPVIRAPLAEISDAMGKGKLTKEAESKMLGPLRKMVKRHFREPSTGFLFDSATYRDEGDSRAPSSVYKWAIDLLQGGGQGEAEIAVAIERTIRMMATVLGTEGLLLGGDRGAYNLGENKANQFFLRVEGTQNEIAEGVDHDVIQRLWDVNGFDPELKPNAMPDPVQFQDASKLGAVLRDLATAGSPILPGDPAVNVIRSVLGLPEAMEDDLDESSLLRNPGGQPEPNPDPSKSGDPANPDDTTALEGGAEE